MPTTGAKPTGMDVSNGSTVIRGHTQYKIDATYAVNSRPEAISENTTTAVFLRVLIQK